MSSVTYYRRKAQGLCPRCGAKPEGKVLCEACNTKVRKYQREVRKMYAKYKICPKCGKNKLFGDEKTCPECLAKAMVTNRKWQKSNSWYPKYIKRLKEQGLCRMCGKRPVEEGKTHCSVCLAKRRETYKKKHVASIERSLRYEYGLCYTCGKPLDRDGKLCTACAEAVTKNLKKGKGSAANHYWRKENKLLFQN